MTTFLHRIIGNHDRIWQAAAIYQRQEEIKAAKLAQNTWTGAFKHMIMPWTSASSLEKSPIDITPLKETRSGTILNPKRAYELWALRAFRFGFGSGPSQWNYYTMSESDLLKALTVIKSHDCYAKDVCNRPEMRSIAWFKYSDLNDSF